MFSSTSLLGEYIIRKKGAFMRLILFAVFFIFTCEIIKAEPVIIKIANTPENSTILQSVKYDPVSEHFGKQFIEVIIDRSSLSAFDSAKSRYETIPLMLANINDYPDTAATLAAMQDLNTRFPAITSLSTIGNSQLQARPMYMLKISDNASTREDETVIWIDGMHHAREPVGMMCSMKIATYLCENYATNATVKAYVDTMEIYIVPIMNPEGYEYFRSTINNGSQWWRKNLRDNNTNSIIDTYDGVDLNRNYDSNWNFGSSGSSDPESLVYKGPEVFSEAETTAKRNQVLALQPLAAITYHQYGEIIYYSNGVNNHSVGESALISSIGSSIASAISKVSGGTYDYANDYSNEPMSYYWMYQKAGAFEFLIETATSFLPDYSNSQTVATNNLQGAIALFNRCLNGPGIQGIVYDKDGLPISAQVDIVQYKNADLAIRRSDPTFGRYRRLTANGTYTLEVRATGYKTKQISGIVVNNEWVTVDVHLEEGIDEPDPVIPVTFATYPNPFSSEAVIRFDYDGVEPVTITNI